MNPLHAAVLGTLQGLTEILPISSSAHLILVPWFFGWPESGLTFDVALHLGTLIALCLYFWRDIIELAINFFAGAVGRRLHAPADRLPFYIIAGTIPAAIAGKTLEGPVEDFFRGNPLLIAILLIAFGLLLGFNREASARFSFLLSLPIVAGAAALKLGHLARHGIPANELAPLIIGIATSAFFGYLSVVFILKLIQKRSLYPFVWYRLLAGGGVLAWIFLGR